MKVIALTGHIATGKTTALKIFSKLGYPTISCDEIYHIMLKTNKKLKKQLVSVFGKKILNKNKISTKKLSNVINGSFTKLKILEKITHPIIIKEVFKKIKKLKKENHKFCIVDVPLLFEKNLQNKFDYVITVYCCKKIQIERLKKRNVKKEILEMLLSRQMSIKQKLKMSDFVINNNFKKKSKLKKEIKKIIKILNT